MSNLKVPQRGMFPFDVFCDLSLSFGFPGLLTTFKSEVNMAELLSWLPIVFIGVIMLVFIAVIVKVIVLIFKKG